MRMRIKGLFKLQDTYGFPLSDSLNKCYENDLLPHLENYIGEALLHNWTDEKISEYLINGYSDSKFGKPIVDINAYVVFVIKKNWKNDLHTTARILIDLE